MTMPALPAAGNTAWRDTWAQAVHDASTEVVDGRLTAVNLAETIRDTIGAAVTAGTAVTVTVNDVADTITIAVNLGTTGTTAAAGNHSHSAASETVVGVVELATAAETTTGTDNTRAVHPAGLKSALLIGTTTQTGTAYTLALGDAGTQIKASNAAAITVTVPPNSSVAFPVGTNITVRQTGAGQVTIAPGAGVTLQARGAALKTAGQYAALTLTKDATDVWFVEGDATT